MRKKKEISVKPTNTFEILVNIMSAKNYSSLTNSNSYLVRHVFSKKENYGLLCYISPYWLKAPTSQLKIFFSDKSFVSDNFQ